MVAVAFPAGLLLGRSSPDTPEVDSPGSASDPLFVPASRLDFGKVGVEKAFAWTIEVINRSKHPVEILKFATSCRCTSVDPPRLTLAPGEAHAISVLLDLTPQNDSELTAVERPFRVTISPHLADKAVSAPFNLSGTVVNAYACEPAVVRFPAELVIGQPFPTAEVWVSSDAALAKLEAQCEPAVASVVVEPLDPGAFRLRLSPRADLTAGPHDFLVKLIGRRHDGTPLPAGAVAGSLRIEPLLRLEPPNVSLGLAAAGAEQIVRVELRTSGQLEDLRAESQSNDLQIEPVSGEARAFRLILRQPSPGPQMQRIVFRARVAGQSGEVSASMRFTYRGSEQPNRPRKEDDGGPRSARPSL